MRPPTASTIAGFLATFVLIASPALARTPSPEKCAAARRKAAGRKVAARMACLAKAMANSVVDSRCVAKAETKLRAALAKTGSACPGTPDAIADAIDSCVATLLDAIPVTTTVPCQNACAPQEIVLTSGPGTIEIGGFPPFPFPPGAVTTLDAGAGDSACRHDVVIPAGGFSTRSYCIPAAQFMAQVVALGCAGGSGQGRGSLWDGNATCPTPDVTQAADSSDGACGSIANGCDTYTGHCTHDASARCSIDGDCVVSGRDKGPCLTTFPGAGNDTLGNVDTTRGGPCRIGGVNAQVDLPVRATVWNDVEGCAAGLAFDPDRGDEAITQFDAVLHPTTGRAVARFADQNGDGCDLPAGALGAGATSGDSDPIVGTPGNKGPVELTGSPAAGPCCHVGDQTTTVAVGAAFSGTPPLYDLIFRLVTPNTVTACNPPPATPSSCTLDPDPCLD
jgi:hypothetical protein